MQLIKFKIFGEAVIHGLTTREAGNFCIEDDDPTVYGNHIRLFEQMGLTLSRLVMPIQQHTDIVVEVTSGRGYFRPVESVDGFITDVPGVTLMVRFADCQGVEMFDPVKKVIAAVHSGWRGNAQNIIGKALRQMKDHYHCKPEDILVGVGPSLGPCCAEFSDPTSELPDFMHRYIEGKHVDLWACAEDQVLAAGVSPAHLEMSRICTSCNTDRFFSYRAEKPHTGRMTGFICL